MSSKLIYKAALVAVFSTAVLCLNTRPLFKKSGTQNLLDDRIEIIYLNGAVGPESIAFDPKGEGPYTGVADGRILKWDGDDHGWVEFAVTTPQRKKCIYPYEPEMEDVCGRPLGLRFDQETGDLYVADAYFGLHVVGPAGGLATPLVTQVDGKPLLFTNDLDIDEKDGAIYFTDTSTVFHRRQFLESILSRDKTGRFMKYDKSSKQVTILLQGIAFSNGVALSKDRSFVLVVETTTSTIIRYWLKGPNAGKHNTFAQLSGRPDNIRRNLKGEFWVAAPPIAIKLSEEGEVLQTLEDIEGRNMTNISEVQEMNGKLWLGSVVMPFIVIYSLS